MQLESFDIILNDEHIDIQHDFQHLWSENDDQTPQLRGIQSWQSLTGHCRPAQSELEVVDVSDILWYFWDVHAIWLVVSTPLKNISQWEGWHPIYYGK